MAVFKATKNKNDGEGKFKATGSKSYDSTMVYDWETKNKNAITTLNQFSDRINSGGFLTADDLASYRKAMDDYIDFSTRLRQLSRSFGVNSSDDDEEQWTTTVSSLEKNYTEISDYFSKWKTVEDFNASKEAQKEYEELMNLDQDAYGKEIAELGGVLDEYKALARKVQMLATSDPESIAATNRMAEISKQYGGNGESGLNALISEKKAYLNRAKNIQEGITLSGVADPESNLYDPEFNSYSGYVSTKTDDWWSKLTGNEYDDTYEYINNQNGFRDEYKRRYNSYSSDNPWSDGESTIEEKGYDYITEDEIAIYNYYYAKDGKDAANKYLDNIQETLNARKAGAMFSGMEDNVLLELAFGVAAGLDQFESGVKNLFNTEDEYIPASATQMASGMVRNDLADDGFKLPDWLGGSSIGQVGYDAITTTANMAPSMLTSIAIGSLSKSAGTAFAAKAFSTVGQVAGNTLMFASAAGNAYQEALNLGYDKGQARAYSTLIGASEAGLQYLLGGISSLGGKASGNAISKVLSGVDNAVARTAIKLGGSMISEGLEEGLQEILTPWFKNITLRMNEDVNWSEVAYSSLLGALTAGFLEGGGTIAGEVKTKNIGKDLQAKGISAQRLSKIGKTFAADTVAYRLAGRVNENTGAYTMGRLFNEIGAELTETNKADVIRILEARGVSSKDAKIMAEGFAAVADGGYFTDKQVAMIEVNDVLAKAVVDVIINPNSTVYQRTLGYKQVLMDLAKEKVSGKTVTNDSQESTAQVGEETTPSESKLTTVAENAAESHYEVSSDGKMVNTKTGDSIDPVGLVQAEDGTYMIATAKAEAEKSSAEGFVGGYSGTTYNATQASLLASVSTEGLQNAADLSGRQDVTFNHIGLGNDKQSQQAWIDAGLAYVEQDADGKDVVVINDAMLMDERDRRHKNEKNARNSNAVSSADVSYADHNQAIVFETFLNLAKHSGKISKVFADMDLGSRNKLLSLYNPAINPDGGVFVNGVLDAFFYGHRGVDLSAASKNSAIMALSEEQRQAAWEAGRAVGEQVTADVQSHIDTVYEEAQNILKMSGKEKSQSYHAILTEGITPLSLNESESLKAAYKLADYVAQAAQVNVYVYASETGEHGFYNHDTDEIWLNLKAANRSKKSMMAFTLAHELVHRAKKGSLAKYEAFTEFLIKEYGKQGSNLEEMIAEQIEAAERFNKNLPEGSKKVEMTREKALEEVVCDACQRMLLDTNAGQKLAEFGAKSKENRGFLEDLKRWITEFMDMLRSLFVDVEPDSLAAKEFGKFDANVKQILADMFVDMTTDSGEKLSTIKAAYGGKFAEQFFGVKDIRYNLAAVDSHKAKLQKEYSEESSTDLGTIMARYDKIIDIWTKLGGELNSKFLEDWNSKVGKDRSFTIFKAQAGYKYNVELSSMCKKGVPLFEAIDTIVKQEVMKELGTDILGKAEKEILYDILKQHHFEIPCAICYVEQARQREGVIIDAFLNGKVEKNAKGETTKVKLGWNQVLDSIEKEMKANGVSHSFAQVSRDIATEKYTPANLDMDTKTQAAFYAALKKIANQEIARYNKAEGKKRKLLNEVTPAAVKECFKGTLPANLKIFKVLFEEPSSRFKIQNDLLYSSVATQNLSMAHNKLYGLFNSQGGVSGYKTKQGTTIYWGDILGKSWKPDTLRNEGGVRNQSNSDFQMYTLLDQAQMYMDFTAKGYYLQAYTKVLSELKLFGLSRGKINASLIPKVVVYRNADGSVDIEKTMATAGLDENGNPIYDDIEGINHAEAFTLIEDPEYSKSICGICIGYSDAHINKLLDDNRVQQIIGFHDKTDDGTKRYKGARYAKNYNGLNEAVNKEGKTVHIGFNPYVKKAEKKFKFNAETETYEGTVNYNGKTYTADDIPRLAADLYLEMCAKKEYTPAYNDFKGHPNYYKLLADFGLYDSQGHYAPHRKVVYNMPDTVPYLDANGKKQTMKTADYIKVELEKELAVRDSIAEALADTSSDGIIPQFKAAVKKSQAEKSYSLPKVFGDAVDKFGTTTNFEEAGFILPSGEMLKFTDDKHRGKRQFDHRAIGVVYGVDVDLGVNHGFNKESGKFLDEFVENGGIRFDAGDPDLDMDIGLQLSSTVPITKAQEQLIRDLVEWKRNREELFEANLTEDNFLYDGPLAIRIDFGGDSRYAVGYASANDLSAWGKKSLEYDGGNINADRIIADIRHYYKTGETRQQSVVSQFHYSYSLPKGDPAPTFYSQMAKVVDGVKQEKLGAASIVSMLRGKGVKAEEIKWSGIETWLDGKKSVTKAELQEFIAGSMLQIEDEILDNKDRPYTEEQKKRLDEYKTKRDEVTKRVADEWKKITGKDLPINIRNAASESGVVNAIIDANKEHKDASFEGRLRKKLYNDLRKVIENNDYFGFDSVDDALLSIHRHRRDFIKNIDASANDKAVIVKYCNALNAYNELPNMISDDDADRLRAIAREGDPYGRKMYEVMREHDKEQEKYTTNWDKYSLKGGKNYREMLFRIPGSTYSNTAMFAHWKERKGVLAHARVQDMDTFIGKMLFIEEIQSDWHNAGSKYGYKDKTLDDKSIEEYASQKVISVFGKDLWRSFDDGSLARVGSTRLLNEITRLYDESATEWKMKNESPPDAPFKDTYHEYVLKRLLRMAAEQDYDSIGWTTADVQMERWNPNRKTNAQMGISDAKNPNAVAFEDGYRIEYDQDIPKFLNKYGKKWGTTVGKTVLDNGTEVWSMAITDSMKESVMYDGQVMYSLPKTQNEPYRKPAYEEWQVETALVDALDHADKGDDNLILVGEMPRYITDKLGIEGDFFIYRNHAYENMVSRDKAIEDGRPITRKGEAIHFHDLGIEKMTDAVMALENPIMAIATKTSEGNPAVVMLLPVKGKNNAPLYAVLSFYSNKPINGDLSKKPHIVLTIAERDFFGSNGRSGYAEIVGDAVKDGRVIDFNKEMRDDLSVIANPAGVGNITESSLANNLSRFLKEIKSFREKNNIDYKIPVGEDTSPRALLANAFEGIITNDIEKRKIQEYKGKVGMLNAEEETLRKLRAQIKEMSFAKGKRDTKRIKELQFDANQTANRIATLDKMLLGLEASAPLQNILKREKEMAYKRAEQKGKEALEAYKKAEQERDQKWQSEVKEKYQASKKKAIETREKREAREKLQKLVLDTVKWISYPTKTDVKCPDILKQPYADFLNGIDLSSKRLANGGDPTKNDLRLANAMGSLATALEKIMTSQNPAQDPAQDAAEVLDTGYLDLPADFVKKLRDMTEKVKDMMVEGDYVVNNMSAAEVRQLSQMIRTLNHAIKEVSTLYANLRFANVETLGNDTMSFMDDLGEIDKTGGVKDFVQWDNALPYYAFKRFGTGGESIFEGLMDAQDKLAFLAQKIFDFRDKAWTDKEAKAWSEDTHTIDLPNGNTLTLTTADAMSIYCLSRREQGLQHLLGGGTRVMGIQEGSKKAKDSRSILTIEDIDAINSSLTDRQRAVAEAIQEFMSTVCSEWGNEISMKRFLTKEFTEKFYFPIESNDENLPTKDPAAQQSDLFRLLNISATKPLTPDANNEVIIRNIFNVFTGHASDMARLNAYGMALLDYMKWLNYREKTVNEEGQINVIGVRKSMEKAYGNAAKNYVLNLVKDVNGRPSDGGLPSFYTRMLKNAKTAMVGNSLRVATLQITSYPRAALVLSPKSLALGLSKLPQIEKAKKYCGIALWKSFGFYDTNISRSIEDQMKGVTDVKQKLIELSLKGAELGDAITWGCLWNACEYEVAKTTKNKVGSEEFYQEVGKKLREVVYRTQVVDSTLTRSQMMRSKNAKAQELSAFMSEPTLSANILMGAGFQFIAEKRRTGSAKAAWKNAGAYIGRAVAVYSIGQLAAALLEGLWDAWRDDEDEEFWKKYLKAFGENLVLDIVPFNKIPIISELAEAVLSMVGLGYFSSDSLSSTALTQTVAAVKSWSDVLGGKSSVTAYNAIYKTTRAISSFLGVSISGVMREGVALWNNTAGAYDSTLKIRQYEPSMTDLGNSLYDAIISGNDRQADSIRDKFRERAEDEKEYQSAVRTAIRKALRENDPRIKEAAQAVVDGNPSERAKIARELINEGYFDAVDIQAAINAEIDKLRKEAKGK